MSTRQGARSGDRALRKWLAVLAGALAIGGAAALGVSAARGTLRHRPAGGPARAATAAPSTPPATEAPAEHDRAIAERACRAWGAALAKGQRPDGSFGTESHRAPSGWNTGQQLAALASAHGCAPLGSAPSIGAATALERLRLPAGWGGPHDPPRAETPATAWVALALAGAGEQLGDSSVVRAAIGARDLLLRGRQSDGGFRFLAADPGGETNGYSTVLALWALVETEPLDPGQDARAARASASRWVRGALRADVGEPPLRSVAGLFEQAVWVLHLARTEVGDVEPEDDALLVAVARDMIARCALGPGPTRACTRPTFEDGTTYLDRVPGRGPNFVTLWHPWATVAAHALLDDSTLDLPADVRADLSALAHWGLAQIEPGIELLGAAPSYKLAEYLIAVSAMLPAPPPP